MQIVTAKQMVKIENESEKLGVSKKQLMQNAGTKLAEVIMGICSSDIIQTDSPKIVFLAGSGNNGGDCFVAAERLVYRGYNVSVVNLVGAPATEIAKEAFAAMPDRVQVITGYRSENVEAAIENCFEAVHVYCEDHARLGRFHYIYCFDCYRFIRWFVCCTLYH